MSVGFRLFSKIMSRDGAYVNVKVDDLIFSYKDELHISMRTSLEKYNPGMTEKKTRQQAIFPEHARPCEPHYI